MVALVKVVRVVYFACFNANTSFYLGGFFFYIVSSGAVFLEDFGASDLLDLNICL